MQSSPDHKPIDELADQYWGSRRSRADATPENALRLAILKHAAADYHYGVKRSLKRLSQAQRSAFLSAKRWLENTDETDSLSFQSIVAELLEADPEKVRRRIMMG